MRRSESRVRQRRPVFREGPKSVIDFERLIEHDGEDIYFHVEPPGEGFFHVLTPDEILARINELPDKVLVRLKAVVLPRMTRKRRRLHCYGLQWDKAVYLYPMPNDMRHEYEKPPRPCDQNEVLRYGGKIIQDGDDYIADWTLDAIKFFYLENILLHEIGHTFDDMNESEHAREAFAEAFVQKYGRKRKRKSAS